MERQRLNPELRHYGVKGMKWGVRRTPAQLGKGGQSLYKTGKKALEVRKKKRIAKQKAKDKADAEAKRKENIELAVKGKKKMSELSDSELAEATKRLEAEKRYKDLLVDTGKVKKGKTAVDTFLKDPAKKIFFDTSVDLAAQGFKSVGADKFNKWLQKEFPGIEPTYANNKKK